MPVSDDTGIFCFTAHCTGCAQKGLTFGRPRFMMNKNPQERVCNRNRRMDCAGLDRLRASFFAGMGETMKTSKNFASRWGFILASVGSAVGRANVWGFPNKLGSNGGGAFLLIYLLFIFIFS